MGKNFSRSNITKTLKTLFQFFLKYAKVFFQFLIKTGKAFLKFLRKNKETIVKIFKKIKKVLKNKSFWKYTLIATVIIIMLAMNIISFIKSDPPYYITNNMVYIFIIISVLIVFDKIESISIGKVFSLNKKIKEKDTEIKELHDKILDLKIANTQSVQANNSQTVKIELMQPISQETPTLTQDEPTRKNF